MTVARHQEPVVLQAKDLPAHCPNDQMPLWSSHPRVFLDLSEGSARCPYCGTEYVLAEGASPASH
ncbi:MAG: zinc-finger domain-containing protein [Betaproteobacteria bacterium]|nr:zinc-finger domain-containing protein [Betaproteobacteria bacterium]NCA15668.1 zinc-finger domain-containing protein [Betaproteobacteria bacterium]